MSSTSVPSPLSNDPPQYTQSGLLPESASEGLRETPSTAAVDPRSSSGMPTEASSIEEIFGRRLSVLAEFMRARPTNTSLVKVIAVDGFDRQAVHAMIANLHYHITRDLQYVVRVISEDSFYPPNNRPAELYNFYQQIQSWGAMWEMILHTSSISSDFRPHKRAKSARVYPANPTASFEYPLIYILPLSPMMATMQAVQRIMGPNDPWRLLSGYWKDRFRPDVTINIQDIADTRNQYEVLRFQVQGMNTLVVSKEGNTGLNINPQQLRRVLFETAEWIRWEA